MDTPICDFVRRYRDCRALRAHMPGHKGSGPLGFEELDITEIDGADSLYEASGIIAKSEGNASKIFGCSTFYSTEGSSQCIRAMLHLATMGRGKTVAAARNVHKTFLSAAALLDLDVKWFYGGDPSYLSCTVTPEGLDAFLTGKQVSAVYITSPDYLGNMADVAALAEVAHRHGALLLVDNAHGAYLKFLPRSKHPMDLGADICCSSAHKTLPVLTGGAYLHIRDEKTAARAKSALALFGSTSPSYLILQSLDAANKYLVEGYRQKLAEFIPLVEELKEKLRLHGYSLGGDEVLKLTVLSKSYGYEGTALAAALAGQGIVCEFADPDHLVLMLTPEMGAESLRKLALALCSIERKPSVQSLPPSPGVMEQVMTVRDAALAPWESIPVRCCAGRILSGASVGCPPAVPIAVCGERLTEESIAAMEYYGITRCDIVME